MPNHGIEDPDHRLPSDKIRFFDKRATGGHGAQYSKSMREVNYSGPLKYASVLFDLEEELCLRCRGIGVLLGQPCQLCFATGVV